MTLGLEPPICIIGGLYYLLLASVGFSLGVSYASVKGSLGARMYLVAD